jgi:hypothetical protein
VLRVAAAVLVAAVALVLAWVSLADRPSGRSAVDRTPVPTATATIPPAQRPPYDRRPGRTPIPAPTQIGDRLAGTLPEVGGPDRQAAQRAANLVLGRYCAEPSRYTFSLSSDDGYHQVTVYLVDLGRSDGPVQQWGLVWTGASYRWFGPLFLADGC